MPVTIHCPHCGHSLLVHDELGVKTRRCSACGQVVDLSGVQAPVAPPVVHAGAMTPAAAIESGHLDYFVEFLAEQHHTPQQRKLDGGKRWGFFVMAPADVVAFAREYGDKFDIYLEEASSPNGRALAVSFHPRRMDHGCLRLIGLALPGNLQAWLHERGSIRPEELRIEKSPMDGHCVQLDFISSVQKDGRRPAKPKVSADSISTACRERLYTFGWNKQEVEMRYFGAQSGEQGNTASTGAEAPPSAPQGGLSPRELALLQHIFACTTGAQQMNDVRGGVDAVLAAPVASRVFASELADLLGQCKDTHLCAAFNGINIATIPLNDNCRKYFRKAEGIAPTLSGPDPRMITLTFALATLAETGRTAPAKVLAEKLVARFMDKCRRGATTDKMDEWHIGRWGQVYYTAAAAILMKERVEQYTWALPILDAVVVEYRHAEEPLYWRALAAYKYWLLKPESPGRIRMAEQRLTAVVSVAQNEPIDPARLDTIRDALGRMTATP